MAHNIQKRDIHVAVRQAWHGISKVVEKIDAENAGILYGMGIEPTFFEGTHGTQRANGYQVFSHDDGLAIGNPVSEEYRLISNVQIWDALQAGLSGVSHKIVSTGTIANRSLGFVSVQLQDDFVAAGRETMSVLNFMWGHGGNRSVTAKTGMTVIVCGNTFNMADRETGDFKVSAQHRGDASLDGLKRAVEIHFSVSEAFQKAMAVMSERAVSHEDAAEIYAGFLTRKGVPEVGGGLTRMKNQFVALKSLFVNGKGNKGETLADVFNGYTDLMTHGNGKADWGTYVSSEFGLNGRRKARFFDTLMSPEALTETLSRGAANLAVLTA